MSCGGTPARFKCVRCGVRYCCKDCQRDGWTKHRKQCQELDRSCGSCQLPLTGDKHSCIKCGQVRFCSAECAGKPHDCPINESLYNGNIAVLLTGSALKLNARSRQTALTLAGGAWMKAGNLVEAARSCLEAVKLTSDQNDLFQLYVMLLEIYSLQGCFVNEVSKYMHLAGELVVNKPSRAAVLAYYAAKLHYRQRNPKTALKKLKEARFNVDANERKSTADFRGSKNKDAVEVADFKEVQQTLEEDILVLAAMIALFSPEHYNDAFKIIKPMVSKFLSEDRLTARVDAFFKMVEPRRPDGTENKLTSSRKFFRREKNDLQVPLFDRITACLMLSLLEYKRGRMSESVRYANGVRELWTNDVQLFECQLADYLLALVAETQEELRRD